jgi:hypothetical protein
MASCFRGASLLGDHVQKYAFLLVPRPRKNLVIIVFSYFVAQKALKPWPSWIFSTLKNSSSKMGS